MKLIQSYCSIYYFFYSVNFLRRNKVQIINITALITIPKHVKIKLIQIIFLWTFTASNFEINLSSCLTLGVHY